jgi:hypothetical protein
MKTIRFLVFLAGLGGLSVASVVAQTPGQIRNAQDGSIKQTLISISIPPLANAPFTATVKTEWTRHLEDGTTVTIKNRRTVARDSDGRIFEERRYLAPNGDEHATAIRQLEFSDPLSHEQYLCDPDGRVCVLREYFGSPLMVPLVGGAPGSGDNDLKSEDLGHNVVGGLDTIGTRDTTPIAAGLIGNDQPLAATREFWFSPQLGINLVENRVDPRSGTASFRVTDIQLGQPDSKMFKPPDDFSIVDARKPAVTSSN